MAFSVSMVSDLGRAPTFKGGVCYYHCCVILPVLQLKTKNDLERKKRTKTAYIAVYMQYRHIVISYIVPLAGKYIFTMAFARQANQGHNAPIQSVTVKIT